MLRTTAVVGQHKSSRRRRQSVRRSSKSSFIPNSPWVSLGMSSSRRCNRERWTSPYCPSSWRVKIPELSVVTLPGLVPDLAAARALRSSALHGKLQDIAAANGLRIITWWWMPGGFAVAVPRAIAPSSVSGLKFQSCGLMQDLLVAAGAQLGEDPAGQIPMLLDMGASAGVAMPYEVFVTLRLHEHAKLASFGDRSLVSCFTAMLMSKKSWDRLSLTQRQAIEEAATASDDYFESVQREIEARALEAFDKADTQVRSSTDVLFTDWLDLARVTVWVRYRETSALSRELLRTAREITSR